VLRFYNDANWLLFTMSVLIAVAAVWVAVEAVIAMGRGTRGREQGAAGSGG
jgi:carbon starvation protein